MKLKLEDQWPELTAVLFLIIGFFLSVLIQNQAASYLSIFLAGGLAGRIYYMKRYQEPIIPYVIIIAGFFLGYLIGAFWINRLLTIVLFAAAFYLSYYLHIKKILVTFKSDRFVK